MCMKTSRRVWLATRESSLETVVLQTDDFSWAASRLRTISVITHIARSSTSSTRITGSLKSSSILHLRVSFRKTNIILVARAFIIGGQLKTAPRLMIAQASDSATSFISLASSSALATLSIAAAQASIRN